MARPGVDNRPATSSDVARLAGVSRSTVSRILNGDDAAFPVSTRDRVHGAAAKLRYRASSAGRSLVKGHNDTIVILTQGSRFGAHLQESVDEVVAQMRPYSGSVVVRVASGSPEADIDTLLGLRPLAVLNFGVLGGREVEKLMAQGVLVVPEVPGSPVMIRDPGIAALQLDVLWRHGQRQLWYAAADDVGPEPFSGERLGALQELCAVERRPQPLVVNVALGVDGGVTAMSQITAAGDGAAVACYNDEVALTLLAGARELAVPVPGHVAIIGMDHSIAGQLWSPRLTSIRVDMHGLVERFVAELRARLAGSVPEASGLGLEQLFEVVAGETA